MGIDYEMAVQTASYTAEPSASRPCNSVSLVQLAYSDTYSLSIYAYYIVIMFQTNGFYYALLIAISLFQIYLV